MGEKTTHFGRAGEYYAMSELLLRGWNVAVPVVDIGDDVFVIDDRDKTTWRLQVKSTDCSASQPAKFTLSRTQLAEAQAIELFYMLMIRLKDRWRFVLVAREALAAARAAALKGAKKRMGSPLKPDGQPGVGDALGLTIEISGATASVWGEDMTRFLDVWPAELAPVSDGPGAIARPAATLAAALSPSPGHGTKPSRPKKAAPRKGP